MLRGCRTSRVVLSICLTALLLPTMTGCGGCRQDPIAKKKAEEEKRREEELRSKKEQPKPDFEALQLTLLPGSLPPEDDEEEARADETRRGVLAKPGHWVCGRYRLKANNSVFQGELMAQCVDRSLRPMDLERSPYRVTSTRPTVLPKAQTKEVEIPIFVAVPTNRDRRMVQVFSHLKTRGGGRDVQQDVFPTQRLKPHQYHLVVLAQNPDRYGYLRSTPSIKPPSDEWAMDGLQEDYIVTLHGDLEGAEIPLPGNPLAWTSIAYLIWDDVPPDALALDQQAALIDWLHWGGQLLIGSPASLDVLRGSFLGDYLPAATGRARAVSDDELQPINDAWSLDPQQTTLPRSSYVLTSPETSPLEIIPLQPISPARYLPRTGQLVVERGVGRGRIVATAFGLADRRVVNWQNFDGFLNGCLLRRPGRVFSRGAAGFSSVAWDRFRLNRQDARLTSRLRFFSRDAAIPGEGRKPYRQSLELEERETVLSVPQRADEARQDDRERRAARTRTTPTATGTERAARWGLNTQVGQQAGYRSDVVGGVAGWNDFSVASNAARQALQQAAGISVPDSRFIARVLAVYLVCLVPLNWLIFRAVRRVEWAWFAAPVIAVVGAAGVVRLAQLDIGFVRSRTEIAILELQPNYSRAHLTRYCGLYTSLTSRYGVSFEDSRAFALPFSTDPSYEQLRLQARQEVAYVRDQKVGMSGYPVLSNSTGMIHVEQMIEWEGSFTCEGLETLEEGGEKAFQLTNNTPWPLRNAVVVGVLADGVHLAVASDLPVGQATPLHLEPAGDGDALFAQLGDDPVTTDRVSEGEVSLRELYRLGLHSAQLHPGDVRLVAWSDQAVPGMDVRPRANQQVFRTLVVGQLRYGPLPEPEVDVNHLADFTPEETESNTDWE